MGTTTAITWTDHTFNPWHGCTRVSPGCDNCYAETFSRRTGRAEWGDGAPRWFPSEAYWRNPIKWNADAEAEGKPHRVFCASMADVFEDRADLVDQRRRLFRLIIDTPWLRWQLLTKRPQNIEALAPYLFHYGRPNVWIGTTVEDQERAEERVPELLQVHSAVRFLSCEPLLGPVGLTPWLRHPSRPVSWVIVGGESGPNYRPLNVDHARQLRDQCVAAGVSFFYKQAGGRFPTSGGDELDGETWKQFPA